MSNGNQLYTMLHRAIATRHAHFNAGMAKLDHNRPIVADLGRRAGHTTAAVSLYLVNPEHTLLILATEDLHIRVVGDLLICNNEDIASNVITYTTFGDRHKIPLNSGHYTTVILDDYSWAPKGFSLWDLDEYTQTKPFIEVRLQ